MKAHPELESIQVMACFLFCRMSDTESHMQHIVEAGALEVVAAAFQNHPPSSRLAQWGAAAALKLTHNSVVRTQLAIQIGFQQILEDFVAASSQESSANITRVQLLLRWLRWHEHLLMRAREHEPASAASPFWRTSTPKRPEALIVSTPSPGLRCGHDTVLGSNHCYDAARTSSTPSIARQAPEPKQPPRISYDVPWWLRCFGVELPQTSTSLPWSPYQSSLGQDT